MAETEAIEGKFEEIDALIDSVEAEGRDVERSFDEGADSATLTEDERRRVERAVGLVLGTDDESSPGSTAAHGTRVVPV